MISKDKTYKTKDGLEVRIYATDCGGHFPVHGAVFLDDKWEGAGWCKDGAYLVGGISDDWDLVEVKPRITREKWINIYDGYESIPYSTKAVADNAAALNRLACIKVIIDCEEGEGL